MAVKEDLPEDAGLALLAKGAQERPNDTRVAMENLDHDSADIVDAARNEHTSQDLKADFGSNLETVEFGQGVNGHLSD